MTRQLSSKGGPPAHPGFAKRNTMAFPKELRAAIPDLHAGRVLELDSITGQASNTAFFGQLVELKLMVKETGKLSGEYVVRMELQIEAARALAATLTRLADEAEELEPVGFRIV